MRLSCLVGYAKWAMCRKENTNQKQEEIKELDHRPNYHTVGKVEANKRSGANGRMRILKKGECARGRRISDVWYVTVVEM